MKIFLMLILSFGFCYAQINSIIPIRSEDGERNCVLGDSSSTQLFTTAYSNNNGDMRIIKRSIRVYTTIIDSGRIAFRDICDSVDYILTDFGETSDNTQQYSPKKIYRFSIRFLKSNRYYVVFNYTKTHPDPSRREKIDYWIVNVKKPVLPVLILPIDTLSLKNGLGYNQKYQFCIAVDGKDLSKYTYKVFNDTNTKAFDDSIGLLYEGKTPIVSLDNVLNKFENIGKNLLIVGFNEGKTYKYFDSLTDDKQKESRWITNVRTLSLSTFNLYWTLPNIETNSKPETLAVLPLSLLQRQQKILDPKTFMFFYISGNDYIDANINQIVTISSEPTAFLKRGSGANSNLNVITIEPDINFLQNYLRSRGEIDVKLEFTIIPELEPSKQYNYVYYTKILR